MIPVDDTLFFPQLPVDSKPSTPVLPWQRWGSIGGMVFNHDYLKSTDHLILSDNLDLLNVIHDGIVDLVYIDPPFATGSRRESPKGDEGPDGYDDSWTDPDEFVEWLAPRLKGLWRILSDHGNLVIHLDNRAVHYVRVWCDRNFGPDRLENEIIWHYTGGGRSKKRFSRKHDVLLWYSKGPKRIFNIDAVREPYKPTSGYAKGGIVSKKGKKYMPHPDGTPVDDVWDIPIVNPMSNERSAYPTQKPLKLLERIVGALSDTDSIVCDIFSGSGTTALAARKLGRRFIVCDNNPDAIGVTLDRLMELKEVIDSQVILSHGLYRIPFAGKKNAGALAVKFRNEIKCPNSSPTVIYPAWHKAKNPAGPLGKGNIIVDFNNADK